MTSPSVPPRGTAAMSEERRLGVGAVLTEPAAKGWAGPEAPRCRGTVEGPIINTAGIVAWRRQCKLRTRHESGLCPHHRDPQPYRTYRGR
jgi:hypothetical protein